MMRHILLTGASGFVGQALLQQLANSDLSVTVICREQSRDKLPAQKNLRQIVVTDSIFDKDVAWWREQLKGIDTVIHSAWYVNPQDYLTSVENIACLNGTLALAQACIGSGVSYFAGIGTCFEYDNRTDELSVEAPLNPQSLYAASKVATFTMLNALFKNTSVQFGWYRLFYLFGANEKAGRLVPYLTDMFSNNKTAILKQANLVRDYLDVDCAAGKIINSVLAKNAGKFNVCSGEGTRIGDLALRIAARHNATHLLQLGEVSPSETTPLKIIGVCNLRDKHHEIR
ncbi:NAD-dependent epimerase/dehydratase family protein [Erwinia psidii]|uniref:NAD(P)-dependent oxidoreductase n=1 Tax=Erwinia psidii TaxID=69224 RepID=A0A3N6S175_9GAMM|nr:NAD(P)-dependent oxidoreductase [Erwinia psidii]MCX8956294.1 NAD(P)-dependent oxidoreductase [Erwinia psidii]MCX8963492.1 NAD(P)-dependent oxidoreductase [Erwinia psidii]RQM39294.1 NAD(P)-dependent oxidoreductase [Erwinia psidii]